MTFSQKIEFSIIQVLIQASNLKITAEGPDGAPLHGTDFYPFFTFYRYFTGYLRTP